MSKVYPTSHPLSAGMRFSPVQFCTLYKRIQSLGKDTQRVEIKPLVKRKTSWFLWLDGTMFRNTTLHIWPLWVWLLYNFVSFIIPSAKYPSLKIWRIVPTEEFLRYIMSDSKADFPLLTTPLFTESDHFHLQGQSPRLSYISLVKCYAKHKWLNKAQFIRFLPIFTSKYHFF